MFPPLQATLLAPGRRGSTDFQVSFSFFWHRHLKFLLLRRPQRRLYIPPSLTAECILTHLTPSFSCYYNPFPDLLRLSSHRTLETLPLRFPVDRFILGSSAAVFAVFSLQFQSPSSFLRPHSHILQACHPKSTRLQRFPTAPLTGISLAFQYPTLS
ncbi:hypothetical protein BU16DRAFT_95747 [Lophium mytilinum]|uniref:Uncharacterized protein n=1 Tax=Lophium mytilinum TaxID=390894 RepID=A0A6A6QKL3_9PEZI|nr:hypothetical protein BU16DRAFT_95747 [Lophium mytilinum]